MYVSQILTGGANTYPQTEAVTVFFCLVFVFLKLGLANMKTAIITVLQLCGKHNLANNSDFISAYTQP